MSSTRSLVIVHEKINKLGDEDIQARSTREVCGMDDFTTLNLIDISRGFIKSMWHEEFNEIIINITTPL